MSLTTTKIYRTAFVYILSILFFSSSVYADHDDAYKQTDTITGAGAHFAWVIFDELKDELEQSTGKKFSYMEKIPILAWAVMPV